MMKRVLTLLLAGAVCFDASAQEQVLTYVGPLFRINETNGGPRHQELSRVKIEIKLNRKLPANAEYHVRDLDMAFTPDPKTGLVIDELRWTNGVIQGNLRRSGKVCTPGPPCPGVANVATDRERSQSCQPGQPCPEINFNVWTDDAGRPVKWAIKLQGKDKSGWNGWTIETSGPIKGRYRQPALNEWRPTTMYLGCPAQDNTGGTYVYPSAPGKPNDRFFVYRLVFDCRNESGQIVETTETAEWVSEPPFAARDAVASAPQDERTRLMSALDWMRDAPTGVFDESVRIKMSRLWSLQQQTGGHQALYPALNLARSTAVRPPADLMARAGRAGTYLGNMLRYPGNVALPTIYVGAGVTPVSFWYGFTTTYKQLELAAQAVPGVMEQMTPAEREFVQALVKGSPQLFAQVNAAIAGDRQALARLAEMSKVIQSSTRLQLLADSVRMIEVNTPLLQQFFSITERPKALADFKFPWDYEAAKGFMAASDMKTAEANAAEWMRRKDKEWSLAQRDAQISADLERESLRKLSDAIAEIGRSLQSSGPDCWDRQEFVLGPGDRPDGESFGLPYVTKRSCR